MFLGRILTRCLAAMLGATCATPRVASAEVMACEKDRSETRVVGVAADGRFITRRVMDESVASCPVRGVFVHDKGGKVTARYVRDCATNAWTTRGKLPLSAKSGETQDVLIARLSAALQTTPLVTSSLQVLATPRPSPDVCLRFSLVEGSVKLPLWQINESPSGCYAHTSVFEHPASKLLFVRLQQLATDPEWCGATRDDVHVVSPSEIEAARKRQRGEQALAAGELKVARVELEAALRLVPELVPARIGLARVLQRSGATWSQAKAALSLRHTSPEHGCLLGRFGDAMAELSEPPYAAWQKSPSFERWIDEQYAAHAAIHTDNSRSGWYNDQLDVR